MPGADEPPVVTQCATPRAAIASARSTAISSAVAAATASAEGRTRSSGSPPPSVIGGLP